MVFQSKGGLTGRTIPAQAPAVLPTSPVGSDENGPWAETTDEQAIIALLRILNRVSRAGSPSSVEKAFVAAARVAFVELTKRCDELLATSTAAVPGTPAAESSSAAPPAESKAGEDSPKRPGPARAARGKNDPTAGGGSELQSAIP